jgi:hypothetical protein
MVNNNLINIVKIVTAICLFGLLTGCTSAGSSTQGTGAAATDRGTGAISAQLVWGSAAKSAAKTVASAPSGVATVRISVTGSDITTLIQKDFVAAAGAGSIDGVPVGAGRTLTAQGLDASGTVTYQGSTANITVQAGKTTDAGTITMAAISTHSTTISEVQLPGGEYEMGDHFGFVDPSHPSDELPIHKVKVSSFYMAPKSCSLNL